MGYLIAQKGIGESRSAFLLVRAKVRLGLGYFACFCGGNKAEGKTVACIATGDGLRLRIGLPCSVPVFSLLFQK